MNQLVFEELAAVLRKDASFLALSELIRRGSGEKVSISGLAETQKPWLAMTMQYFAGNGKKPCFIVSDELKARALASELRALTDKEIYIFRPRELNLTDAEAVSRESERQRLSILANLSHEDTGGLIIPAAALLQKLMPPDIFSDALLHLHVGDQIDLDDLCGKLMLAGYERRRQVDEAGQFARRGDILDVVPAVPDDRQKPQGIRFSFFDIEIDAIKDFDLETQRSLQMKQSAVIPPAHEIILYEENRKQLCDLLDQLSRPSRYAARAGEQGQQTLDNLIQLVKRDCERLRDKVMFAGLDRWLHQIYPEAASVLDFAENAGYTLFVDEFQRVRSRLDAAQAEFRERYILMLEKGQLAPESDQIVFRGTDAAERIEQYQQAVALCQIASSGNSLTGSRSFTIQGQQPESYRGREQILISHLREWQKQGGKAVLFAGSAARQQRLKDLIKEYETEAEVLPDAVNQGFVWPKAGLMVIGVRDIFGSDRSSKKKRRRSGGMKIDLFSDLVPGELVVHEAHGIGCYEGLVNLETNGSHRDYLHIRYGGDDSLYLPMESLDQIQKYVGTDGRKPKLSKLGGQEWNRMKERAKDSIRKLATDLIKLYAERMAVKGHQFAPDTVWQQEFEDGFPYEETEDQLQTIDEIKADMESDKVMDRLLCGDVGFGKTEVAFRAVFKCVMDGKQAVFLAPTTVLAQQHYENFKNRVEEFPVKVGLLSRFAPERIQKETLKGLEQGSIDVLIGTHRVFSKDVHLKNLGFLVVDEEQRFGVDHKEQIKTISPGVDVLTLTATPIPRTLHMAMSGIRDISVLEEPPHDRRSVQTYVMEYDAEIVGEAMLREISRNGQIFYLFNDTKRIIEKTRALEKMLPGANIVYAHGKMGARRLEDIISSFIAHESDILVCTTIIESGIDMPNVNTLIVENADHFGLAQLYQLRGRVGRADKQAYAYITYKKDKVLTEVSEKRLTAIRDFTELGSGFKIALRDLEVRGAGNLLGAEQHGQLEAIGYDLYCRMLEDTIKEMQGETKSDKTEALIDIETDAYLPPSYIPDEGQRMDMYRRVADIETRSDYQDVMDEWLDRYGEPPEQSVRLADIAFIRSAAGRCGFASIEQQHKNIRLIYAADRQPDMQMLSRVLSDDPYKGKLLFNAGTKPYLVYLQAAFPQGKTTDRLMALFTRMEKKE